MRYDGINAKVRAMRGKLLKFDDYSQLAQFKAVDDVARRLRELGSYERAIASLGSEEFHRGYIEQKILLSLAGDFMKIYTFIGDHNLRGFLDAFYLQYEIEVIKILLCSVLEERSEDASFYSINELSVLIRRELRVDIPKLMSSKTVSEFIENLRGTVFYNVLSKKYADDTPTLFDLEMELDVFYYTNLWSAQSKLDKRNRNAMKYITGTEIDLRNIQWMYRLKNYYKLSDNAVYAYLVPVRYLLTQPQIARIAEAKNTNDLWDAIGETRYTKYFSQSEPIENGFFTAMNRIYAKAQINSPNSLSTAVSYLHFKEVEIRNVVTLLECVRYGMRQEETMNYLMLGGETS